jgi:hypothetical protein
MCSEAPRTSGTGVPHGIQRATREDGRDQVRGISSRLDLAVLYFCIRVACFPRHIRIMDCSLLCCAWRCRFTLPQGMSIGSAINNVHVNPVTPDPCATRAVEGSSEGSSNSRSPMAGLKAYLATRLNMLAIQKSKMFGDWQVKLDADGDHLVYFHSEFPEETTLLIGLKLQDFVKNIVCTVTFERGRAKKWFELIVCLQNFTGLV